MKLTKKIIAAVAALSLTMASTATVFAEESIPGGAEYLNTTIYKVTLPTTAGISFTLDPQGLLNATPGADLSTLTGAGDVSSSGVMVAYSESSVDVKCKASFYVDAPETLAVSDAAAITSASTTTKAAVGLQINYASKDNGSYATDVSGATIATVSSPAQLDVTATSVNAASVISPTLAKVSYVVTGNATDGFEYVKSDDDEASILYMYVGGKVTTKADWSDYTGADSVKLKAVFTFTKDDGSALATEIPTPGLEAWDGNSIWIKLSDSDVRDSITKVSIKADGGNAVVVTDYEKDFNADGCWVGLDFDKASLASYANATRLDIDVEADTNYTCTLWDNN